MDIFYAFNDAYAALAGISIYSLLQSNKECDSIRFYIVDSGISKVNRDKIQNLVLENNREISFFEMPSFSEILGKGIDTGRWNINVYSKLFVGGILPDDVHKVISIDCDTVIEKSLKDLWEIDLSTSIVAGVNEAMSKYYRRYLGKKDKDYYLNSGLLMFNVDAIREEGFETVVFKNMRKYGGTLPYLDQDLVNAIVPQERMLILPPKFNVITPIFCCTYKELIKARRASAYYTKTEFTEAKDNPYIIHFTTFFLNDLRPWVEGSKHPKLDKFLEYKNESPWRNEPLWKDKRGGGKKVKGMIISLLPRSIACSISSVLHGVIVPRRTLKKINDYLSKQRNKT